MTMITNRKVQGFVPVWAPFKGFSLLFDNPGESCSRLSDFPNLAKIDCRYGEPELSFYRNLWDAASGAGELMCSYLFCPLPLHSYHVTVWDGINDFNVRKLPAGDCEEAARWLQSLPGAFHPKHKLFAGRDGEPIGIRIEPIDFVFERLEKWNNSSIVARLAPVDSRSQAVLSGIEEEREKLNRFFEERFGLATASKSYRPHVSIGYLGNKELGEKAEEAVQRLNVLMESAMSGQTLRFTSVSMYGMTDMETFFRWA
ncbi:hypothetical protein FE783_01180 [Paenibacillus mesophilus]|uniref:hypothetical protein n=1 Tax=Paenibacillus mesophilus TaxID=2582849 RepID=UPI00110F43FA|nr:hypothetical protein [Paenibacillus mesophilus]TMV52841.1 hypothetical protein FE783_01180 [Paenibacillus mesophilus]